MTKSPWSKLEIRNAVHLVRSDIKLYVWVCRISDRAVWFFDSPSEYCAWKRGFRTEPEQIELAL